MPLLLPCNVTRRYWPVEYTGYGLAVPQNVPRKGEILVIKDSKGSLLQRITRLGILRSPKSGLMLQVRADSHFFPWMPR